MAISKSKLQVGAFADLIILRPNSAIAHDESGVTMPHDSLLQGSLQYALSSAQGLKSMRVELVGTSELLFADRAERYETLNVGVDLDLSRSKILEAGMHEMVFTLRIPATAAPHERNAHGKTEHVLRALVVKDGWLSKTIIAEQCITAVVNHNPDPEGLPLPFAMDRELLGETLGPIKLQLTSRFLLIAGFLQLSLLIPAVTRKIRLDDVVVNLSEYVRLESRARPGFKEDKPSKTTQLCSLIEDKRNEPVELEAGDSFSLNEQFRIPIFARISASTANLSETGLRISHKLSVQLKFTPLEDNVDRKVYGVTAESDCIVTAVGMAHLYQLHDSLRISSLRPVKCACVIDALQLPSYSEALASKLPPLKNIGFCSECLCHIADTESLRQMYGVPDEDMKRALEWRSLGSTAEDTNDECGWKSRRSRAPH